MRLIDGEELANEILGEIFERGQASGLWEQQLEIGAITYADIEFSEGYDSALENVYRQISDMKTVDAMPVIRCKECHFYKEENLQCMMHEGDTEEWYDNDFCSLAERKEFK